MGSPLLQARSDWRVIEIGPMDALIGQMVTSLVLERGSVVSSCGPVISSFGLKGDSVMMLADASFKPCECSASGSDSVAFCAACSP